MKLATTDKLVCLIGGYVAHSHKFSMNIPTGNTRWTKLQGNMLKNKHAVLKSLKNIFFDEYSMLRLKGSFHISERLKQVKCNKLFLVKYTQC